MSVIFEKPIRLIAICATTLALAACDQSQAPMQGQAPLVSTVKVSPERAVIVADLPGRVNAVRDAQVRARVTGIVENILFTQGSNVKAGELLFEIDPAPYEAAYQAAHADLERAKAQAESANQLAKRYAPLVKVNAVSRQEYDDAVAQANQGKASILAAEAALKNAQINLNYTKVTSPIDGRVGQALVTEGALVEATTATTMALVQQLDPVYVDVFQSTSALAKLRRAFSSGQLQKVSDEDAQVNVILEDGSVYSQPGKLLFTGVTVDPGTGQVVLRVEINNPDNILLPGMFVRVQIEQGVDEQALAVPPQALQRAPNGLSNLYVVRDGVAIMIPVTAGNRYKDKMLILDGLEPNDEVVVEGFQKIRSGVPVTTKPWQPSAS